MLLLFKKTLYKIKKRKIGKKLTTSAFLTYIIPTALKLKHSIKFGTIYFTNNVIILITSICIPFIMEELPRLRCFSMIFIFLLLQDTVTDQVRTHLSPLICHPKHQYKYDLVYFKKNFNLVDILL